MPPGQKDDNNMSPEEIRALESRLENSLQKMLILTVKEEFRDIKSIITELFNKDIDYLKEQQETFKQYHSEHYAFRDSIKKEVDEVKSRMDKFEAAEETEERINENTSRQSELTWGKVVGIATIVGVLVAGITKFIP